MKQHDAILKDLPYYSRIIIEDTGCELEDVSKIENIMRDLSSRTALDDLSRADFCKEARNAHAELIENSAAYEEYFAGVARSFDIGKARTKMEAKTP